MKKTLILIFVLAVALVYVHPAMAQEENRVWQETSPVYVCTQTSRGLLVFQFDSLPSDYQLPTEYYYRTTLPEPDLIVAYYPAYIVAGIIEFGPAIFVSPFFVGNFVSFETFYFREFRTYWHSGWRAHSHWRHFDSRHHAQFARHKSTPLFNKLAGHPGFRGDKHFLGSSKPDGQRGIKHDPGQKQPSKAGPPPKAGISPDQGPGSKGKTLPPAKAGPPPKAGISPGQGPGLKGKTPPPAKTTAPGTAKAPPPAKAGPPPKAGATVGKTGPPPKAGASGSGMRSAPPGRMAPPPRNIAPRASQPRQAAPRMAPPRQAAPRPAAQPRQPQRSAPAKTKKNPNQK